MVGPSFFVLNGHTLGYVYLDRPSYFGVLHGDIKRGGRDWRNGPVILTRGDELVPATRADFDLYRVDPKGHLDDDCGQCEGTGRTKSASNGEDEVCPICDGHGIIPN